VGEWFVGVCGGSGGGVVNDNKAMFRAAQKAGWRVEQQRGGHTKMWCPCGEHLVVTSSTPSEYRALRNLVAQLRRCPAGGFARKAG
jgi:predicted RNA binding protein YcfA (HicA-like mRNA interferase family)